MGAARTAITNYTNRTVDLLLLQFVPHPVEDCVVRPDVTDKPRMATGIEKLVQRYALLFLTQAGTVKNREAEGTDFLGTLGTGQIYNESTLRAAAARANDSVCRQIKVEDEELDTEDDEALDSANIEETRVDRATATVFVKVRITSKTGESFTYVTPVETGL